MRGRERAFRALAEEIEEEVKRLVAKYAGKESERVRLWMRDAIRQRWRAAFARDVAVIDVGFADGRWLATLEWGALQALPRATRQGLRVRVRRDTDGDEDCSMPLNEHQLAVLARLDAAGVRVSGEDLRRNEDRAGRWEDDLPAIGGDYTVGAREVREAFRPLKEAGIVVSQKGRTGYSLGPKLLWFASPEAARRRGPWR